MKRQHSSTSFPPHDIYFSAAIEEQTSTFTAAFSPSQPAKTLQALPQFHTATHKIAAWRTPSRQKCLDASSRTLYDVGHDDDGEKWAGARLSNVLVSMQMTGTVVVARWYGGQNIGPIRFAHIESSAKAAIRAWKAADAVAQGETRNKKIKAEEEGVRSKLVKNLQERDYNIFALRKLLGEKKAKLVNEEPGPLTPAKPVDYAGMSMEGLARVDKARDATIAFVLKQIDKADGELKLLETIDEDS
ncbi:IMPACT family member [Pyrenophora seminiperda CCB06]|uniref:IMPACT family member n=1 Tax=Pyrenophora seminiperda CCB06 TaxID=1302712 RepID=A0A3M7MI13_9PLEO|nr:IMPACT family member [Pyrenophora seminiperda CCB06]